MTALGIGIIGAGVLFVVCGVKDLDPRSVTLALFTGDPIPGKGSTYTPPGTASPRSQPGGAFATIGQRVGAAVDTGD